MKEALRRMAYIALLHLVEVLEQVKLISGNKSKQWLGVDDGRLLGKEQRELSEVMGMFYIFIGVSFIWFSAIAKIEQTVYLRSVHFPICNLY